ncbi:MAG TPA: tape measure protein [Roseococcus sp.]|jgi:tape measure domain-containing protein|nr:tape measure protein [Roseococcus sp.]
MSGTYGRNDVITALVFDARPAQQGAQQFQAAGQQVIQANQQVTQATQRTADSQTSLTRAVERMTRQLDPAAAAAAKLARDQELLDRAHQRGLISAERYARNMQLLQERQDRASQAAQRAVAANDNLRGAMQQAEATASSFASRLGPLGAALSSIGPAGLAAAAALGALFVAARQVAQAGDQFTTTMNRLQAATGSVEAAGAVYRQLVDLSQQTGAAIGESANAFVRFSIAAREIGATNSQVITLTRTIQQAGIIAGSSAQESAAGVLQLGQALASGRLQGDELRSILENMPTLAEALARELGVSVGQLRTMGSEGQLTSDRVFQALLRASEQINEQFERMTPTMGRAFSALGQAMLDFVGRLDQALGLSQGIARAATAAAAAVRGAGGFFFPDEGQRAAADVQGSLARQQALEAQIAAAAGGAPVRPGSIPRGAQIAGGSAAANAERLAELRAQLAAEQAVYAEAQERVERLRAEGNFAQQAEEDRASRQRLEAQRAAATAAFNTARDALDREAKAREDHRKRLEAIDAGLAAGATTAAEATRLRALANEELARALQRIEGGADRAARATNRLTDEERAHAREIERGVALVQQTQTEAQKYEQQLTQLRAALDAGRVSQEQFNRAVSELDPAQRAARQAAQRATQEREREANQTVDRITNFFGDAFARAFENTGGGFRSLMDSFRRAAISTFASIAAQAIIRPIIAPIFGASAGGGTLGNLGNILGGGTGGLGGGLDQVLSGVGLGRSLGGGSLFGSGGMFGGMGTSIGNFLSTPLYTPSSAFSPSNFGALMDGTQGSMTVTMGSALGAIGGIGAGAFGIYNGIQRGGIGGAVQGLGGAAGMAAGMATLTGIGASLAPILGPAALALGIIGSLLPGQRPSSRMQGVLYDFGAEQPRNIGFGGNRFSAENRSQADQIAASIMAQEAALAQQLGFRAAGGFDLRVGNERGDGPGIEFRIGRGSGNSGANLASGPATQRFNNDEAGLRALSEYAAQELFRAFQDTASDLSTELAGIVRNSANLEALTGNLEFFNGAYRALQDVTGLTDQWTGRLRDLVAPFDAAIERARALGLAEQGLADARAAAVADAEGRRSLSFDNLRRGLFGRERALAGDDLTASLAQFDIQATQQIQATRDALRDLGIVGEVAADTLLRNERILGEERLALQRELSERQNAAIRQSAQGVLDWLNNQRLGANSSLSPFAQMEEAERQFRAAQQAGDLAGLTRSADALLSTSRNVLGGATEAYAQREMFVRQTVAQTGQRATEGMGDAALIGAFAQVVAGLQNEIRTLNERIGEMAAQQRRDADRRAVAA